VPAAGNGRDFQSADRASAKRASAWTLRRARELARVTVKYGLGLLLRRVQRRPVSAAEVGARLRAAFEELGVTYLKLGQYLATRFDLLPEEICEELNKLLEDVPPMSFETVTQILEAEFGVAVSVLFPELQPTPIGAASVAQVHRARTTDGDEVAVKVQRPEIADVFDADIRLMRLVTGLLDASGAMGRLSTTELLDEFATWTRREMDFLVEARTAQRVRAQAAYATAPRVLRHLTTSRVLTLEFIPGLSLGRIMQLLESDQEGVVRQTLPDLQLQDVLHQVVFESLHELFVTGFFHGDPHPGNILVRADNSVVLIDFGIFGELTPYERQIVTGLAENLATGDVGTSFRYYAQELMPTDDTDPRAFERDAKHVLRQWYESAMRSSTPAEQRHLGHYITEMIAVSRRNSLRMGRGYLLFWRTLGALDTITLRVPGASDFLGEMRRFFEQTRPGPFDQLRALVTDPRRLSAIAALGAAAPQHMAAILDNLTQTDTMQAIRLYEPPRAERDANLRVKLLSAAVLVVSFGLLGIGLLGRA
jgi:ubiquinone biosynthesis protein